MCSQSTTLGRFERLRTSTMVDLLWASKLCWTKRRNGFHGGQWRHGFSGEPSMTSPSSISVKVGAEGFEPPSTGLEPVVIPSYTIPPRVNCGRRLGYFNRAVKHFALTACSAYGQHGVVEASCDATSIADCRPSSRLDCLASWVRPTYSPYMSESGDSGVNEWAIQDSNPCSRIRNPR